VSAATPSSRPGIAAVPALPDDAVEVGRVLGAWGIKGAVKVRPHAGDPQALFSSKRWYLQPPEGARPPGPAPLLPPLLRVLQAREQGDGVVATAQEVPDRDAAEALQGARVFISRASFPTPAADEFYWVDLIGLSVLDRGAALLGTVVGLIETGPHCVLRVQPPQAQAEERLIPFVSAYVDQVDLVGRRIVVDWEADY
jgi:16S rRNA processing protein RimM